MGLFSAWNQGFGDFSQRTGTRLAAASPDVRQRTSSETICFIPVNQLKEVS